MVTMQGPDTGQYITQVPFLGSFVDAGMDSSSLDLHTASGIDESIGVDPAPGSFLTGNSAGVGQEDGGVSRKKSTKARGASISQVPQTKNSAAQRRYRERQKDKMEVFKQQVEMLSKQLEALQTENENLEERNRLLEKVVQLKEKKGGPEKEEKEKADNGRQLFNSQNTYLVAADYLNTVRRHEAPISVEGAANITPEDLRQIRLDYVKELAKLLLKVGDGADQAGMRELEDYVLSVRLATINLIQSMTVRSFAQVLSLKKRILNASFVSERIMLAMNLSWDQKRDYIRARHALINRNEEIRRKRRDLVAKIEAAVPGAAPLMCSQKATLLNACESSDLFKSSLEDEHRSTGQFHIDCVQVLTPLQEARALIEAHPGAPDHWLISGYLEAERAGRLEEWLKAHLSCNERQQLNNTVQSLSSSAKKNSFVVAVDFDNDTYAASHPANTAAQDLQRGTDIEQPLSKQQWQPHGAAGGESMAATKSASFGSEQNHWAGSERVGRETGPARSGSDSVHRPTSDHSCQAAYQTGSAPVSNEGQQYWNSGTAHFGGGYLPVSEVPVSNDGPVVSLTDREAMLPMQTTPQGLQTVADMPTWEMMDGLTDYQEDDMWLDLFPGLITQT